MKLILFCLFLILLSFVIPESVAQLDVGDFCSYPGDTYVIDLNGPHEMELLCGPDGTLLEL